MKLVLTVVDDLCKLLQPLDGGGGCVRRCLLASSAGTRAGTAPFPLQTFLGQLHRAGHRGPHRFEHRGAIGGAGLRADADRQVRHLDRAVLGERGLVRNVDRDGTDVAAQHLDAPALALAEVI